MSILMYLYPDGFVVIRFELVVCFPNEKLDDTQNDRQGLDQS